MRRIPAIFRDSWVPAAKIFYTLETLGELEHLHGHECSMRCIASAST